MKNSITFHHTPRGIMVRLLYNGKEHTFNLSAVSDNYNVRQKYAVALGRWGIGDKAAPPSLLIEE